VTVGCLFFYIYASDYLGFIICATLLLAVMFAALEVRPKAILPIALIVTMVIHFIFYKGLRVPLPWGLLMPIQW
jgi:putative tricarboxylic transport membrane protein